MKLITFKIHENYYNFPESSDPFMPPFSEGIFLLGISKTHSVIYNKYPVFKDHLLVITRAYEN
jgi:ATP adenylyltransferase/5',5'''-P-1,P-4-tetraphosphate phosphorylase II